MRKTIPQTTGTISLLAFMQALCAGDANWAQFRGPNASGVLPDRDLPVEFGPASNVVWKTPVPPGNSSTCIWGNSIFLTAFTENKRLVVRLKFPPLRQTAIVEDIDLRAPRGIDRAFLAKLVDGDWISRKQNLLITGPTGVGKSWIACALGHKACRDNRSVLYHRMPRMFEALALARGDGRHARLLKALSRVELLILDDWGLAPLTGEQRRDLLEIVDDRHQRGSTIITSQVPVDHWHEVIADPTIADGVLDRLVHNAHRLELRGDSMRKLTAQRTSLDAATKP